MNIVSALLQFTLFGSEWVLWLLVFLSIVSIGIMLERMVYYWRLRLNFGPFSEDVLQRLHKDDFDGIVALCERTPSLESQTVLHGLEYRVKGPKAMDESMTSFITGERQFLDRGLIVLGTLGNNAPFIGLFGTVICIIKAFHDLASNPAGGPSVVMAGISEALVATAVGLLVAIPAVVAYNAFTRIVKRRIANAETVRKLLSAHFS